MDERAQDKVLSKIYEWLNKHKDEEQSSEKVRRCQTLLDTNRTLQLKLDKLKLLYEKKNAQYEAMKAVADLEKDLQDMDLKDVFQTSLYPLESVTDEDFMKFGFLDFLRRIQNLPSAEEKEQFFVEAAFKSVELFKGVKEHAKSGIVSEDVMTCCMEILGQENPDVLFMLPSTIQSLLIINQQKTNFDMLHALNASEYNSFLFPLFNETSNENFNHWSLLVYAKNINEYSIFHYDSSIGKNRELARKFLSVISPYFGTTELIEVQSPQQKSFDECGFHVIEIATKILPLLETGKMLVGNVEITLTNINLLKVFTHKCRVMVLKLYTQRKLQLLQEYFAVRN